MDKIAERRRAGENLLQLAIVTYPHIDHEDGKNDELVKRLLSTATGEEIDRGDGATKSEVLDREGLKKLKTLLNR